MCIHPQLSIVIVEPHSRQFGFVSRGRIRYLTGLQAHTSTELIRCAPGLRSHHGCTPSAWRCTLNQQRPTTHGHGETQLGNLSRSCQLHPLASNPSAEEEPPVITRYNNSHPCWTFQAFGKLSASSRLTQHAVPSALPQLHPLCCSRCRLSGLANCSFWSWEYR